MGTDYWHEILRFIEQMAKAGMIAPSDMQVVYVTDSVDDAIAHIRSHAIERFALLAVRRVRPHWRWLGERGLPPPLIALSNLRPPGPTVATVVATLTNHNASRSQDEQRNSRHY
jgi:hypothetical protein